MPFDLKKLNPTAKFYWENGSDEWVELRLIPRGELRRLRKETIKHRVEYYRPKRSKERPHRYEVDDIDDDLLFELIWDYQISDWNIKDESGEKIPCTKENKMLIINNSKEFSDWVAECIIKFAEDQEEKKENSEKN